MRIAPFFWVWFCEHIRCCGNGLLWFRPYGGSPFPNAEKVTQKACSYVRPARWGSGFLRSGIDPGAAPTVCFAAPPLAVFGCAKRSLRSHARMNPSAQPSDVAPWIKIKSGTRANAHCVEWGGFAACGARNLNCRSQPAGEGGLRADQSLTDPPHPPVGVSLLAKAA